MRGTNIHDRICGLGRIAFISLSKTSPMATASGAMAHARNTKRYDRSGSGQTSECSRWVTGDATATARLDVIKAVPIARGCHVPSRIRVAKNAPPSGTL